MFTTVLFDETLNGVIQESPMDVCMHFGMLVHLKFVPDIFLQSFLVMLLETSYKTNFANIVCDFPLTKLPQISKDCRSVKWCFLDHFYENQNDKYNKELAGIGFGWTCVSNRI